MGNFKRLVRAGVEAATSQVATTATLWTASIVAGLCALPDTSFRGVAVGFAGGFFAVVLTKFGVSTWEYRHENETILTRSCEMRISRDGTHVVYRDVMRIRARRKNLVETANRFGWSGESLLIGNAQPVGTGFEVILDRATTTGKGVELVYRFDRPLRRWRTMTVGVEFNLDEPNKTYTPHMSIDAASSAWGLFSRLEYTVIGDGSGTVDFDSVEGLILRSAWDRHRRTTAPLNVFNHDRLIRLDNGRCWRIRPVRPERVYDFSWKLH